MNCKILYLLCGLPGSGKTTWAKANKTPFDAYVSRDEIRFKLLREGDSYFQNENEVFDTFVKKIAEGLNCPGVVFADATHLSEKSRNKLLDKLRLDDVDIIPINFYISLDTCCKRNDQRTGRARVPIERLSRMKFIPARFNEKYHYAGIYNVYENGEETYIESKEVEKE